MSKRENPVDLPNLLDGQNWSLNSTNDPTLFWRNINLKQRPIRTPYCPRRRRTSGSSSYAGEGRCRLLAHITELVRKGDFFTAVRTAKGADSGFRDLIVSLCFKRLLDWKNERISRFLSSVEPTTDNLCDLIERELDQEAVELMRRGAVLDCQSPRVRGVLLSLFSSERMHRTISYIFATNMIDASVLSFAHFQSSLCSPNIALTRLLLNQPHIAAQVAALDDFQRSNLQALSMWWTARYVLEALSGHEAMRLLMRSNNVNTLSDDQFIDVLHMFNILTHVDRTYIIERRNAPDESQYAFAMPLYQFATRLRNQSPTMHDLEELQIFISSQIIHKETADATRTAFSDTFFIPQFTPFIRAA